jgi:hypothetical protein
MITTKPPTVTGTLSPWERHQICATGALCDQTLRRVLRGEPVRPIVMYRFRAALVQLGLHERFPELLAPSAALGGAADPDPRQVLEPADAIAQDPEAMVEI